MILRKYQDEQDGATVYQEELIDHYEHKSNKSLIKAKCTEELVALKLTPKFFGGPKKFFLQFQNIYLDLENTTESTISDEEKIRTLNATLQDPRFTATRTSVETVALQTRHPIVYDSYLQALESQAQSMSTASAYERQSNSTNSQRGRGGGGSHASGGYGGDRGDGRQKEKCRK